MERVRKRRGRVGQGAGHESEFNAITPLSLSRTSYSMEVKTDNEPSHSHAGQLVIASRM